MAPFVWASMSPAASYSISRIPRVDVTPERFGQRLLDIAGLFELQVPVKHQWQVIRGSLLIRQSFQVEQENGADLGDDPELVFRKAGHLAGSHHDLIQHV